MHFVYALGTLPEIRSYCEQDVLCTYLLYLKYTNHTGRITSSGYKKCIDNLREFVVAQDKEHNKSVIKNLKLSK